MYASLAAATFSFAAFKRSSKVSSTVIAGVDRVAPAPDPMVLGNVTEAEVVVVDGPVLMLMAVDVETGLGVVVVLAVVDFTVGEAVDESVSPAPAPAPLLYSQWWKELADIWTGAARSLMPSR